MCYNLQCALIKESGGSPIFLRETDYPKGRFFHPVFGYCKVVYIPCGQCLGCRIDRRMDLTMLQCLEASLYDYNWFITLTYDDEKYWQLENDVVWSLRKDHFQKFNELMRKHCFYYKENWRFYGCGEYGERFKRPHYHLSVFGVSPEVLGLPCYGDDKNVKRKGLNNGKLLRLRPPLVDANGRQYWQSSVLASKWKYGQHKIYRANRDTFQYVAGYVTKKLTGDLGDDFKASGRLCEFGAQSRPSIGRAWFDKFYSSISVPDEVHKKLVNDCVSVCGYSWRLPRIFDRWFLSLDHFDSKKILERIKQFRSIDQDLLPDREEEKRKADFNRFAAERYKILNLHKEIT